MGAKVVILVANFLAEVSILYRVYDLNFKECFFICV